MRYETVIGLEVHVELKTKSKIFCTCSAEFGGEPNTHTCPVCLGLPGTLPTLNRKAVELGVRAGLAADCEISHFSRFDRKNYFYPDLPKAYQISQLYLPLCKSGSIALSSGKVIRIKEMHLEEDAGKLMHSPSGNSTLIDYNRCGVPLLEIVSEPDMSSAEEAAEYLEKLRELMQFTGVSDCKMQEGSLRADINVSVRPEGSSTLGERTEMKNLNSFSAAVRAIKAESERQIELIEKGEKIIRQTRRWDDSAGASYPMRSKEDASDYKYFPEPDLPPILLDDCDMERIRSAMPELPDEKRSRFAEMGLSDTDIATLFGSPSTCELFERTAALCGNVHEAAAWITVELPAVLRDSGLTADTAEFDTDSVGKLINMLLGGKISRTAAKKVFKKLVTENAEPETYVREHSLGLITDSSTVLSAAKKVIAENEKSVLQYKNGKTQAFQFLIGQCMRALGGKASAQAVSDALHEMLGD